MIKTTRIDELDLNTDGALDLDKVNAFLNQLQEDYTEDEEKEEEKEDGE